MQPTQAPTQQPVYAAQPQTDGKATASLILGILSVTCLGLLTGIPAIILGHISRKNIRESLGRLKGEGLATAGLVMGYISVALIPVILIIAAIAIPNLLRSRMAANESAAASTVRTLNTSQVTYSTSYPAAGYARELALLGSGGGNCQSKDYPSAQHACLVSDVVAGPRCTAGVWCTKNGFNFSVAGICGADGPCTDYVITATPVSTATGIRSLCSVSDGVIRYRRGPPLAEPLTSVDDCLAWPPLSD